MNEVAPRIGQVIRYAFLWRDEAVKGLEEGRKDRPAVIVVLLRNVDGRQRVVVAPITHTPPTDARDALSIPPPTAHRIGLDSEPQWVVLTDLNAFIWPGPDLRPEPGEPIETAVIGSVSRKFMATLNERVQAALSARRTQIITRTEVRQRAPDAPRGD